MNEETIKMLEVLNRELEILLSLLKDVEQSSTDALKAIEKLTK